MIEASMAVPPGLRAVHPQRDRARRSACRSSGWAGSRTRCRPSAPWPTGHCDLVGVVRGQIADPDFARQGPLGARRRDPDLPVLQPGMRRPDGPEPVAGLHREPAHRPGGRSRPAAAPRRAGGCVVVGGGPGRPAGRAHRGAQRGHRRTLLERQRVAGRAGRALAARCRSRAEFVDLVRNLRPSASASGSRSGPASTPTAPWLRASDPTPSSGHRRASRSRRTGRAGLPRVVDVRDVLEGRAGPPGRWSWSTSSASIRPPGRRAAGRPGLRGGDHHRRHGRRPGSRHHPGHGDLQRGAHAKGIRAGHRSGGDGRGRR